MQGVVIADELILLLMPTLSPAQMPIQKHSLEGAFGSPNFLSYKGIIGKQNAITANLSFSSNFGTLIFADYQFLQPGIIKNSRII